MRMEVITHYKFLLHYQTVYQNVGRTASTCPAWYTGFGNSHYRYNNYSSNNVAFPILYSLLSDLGYGFVKYSKHLKR